MSFTSQRPTPDWMLWAQQIRKENAQLSDRLKKLETIASRPQHRSATIEDGAFSALNARLAALERDSTRQQSQEKFVTSIDSRFGKLDTWLNKLEYDSTANNDARQQVETTRKEVTALGAQFQSLNIEIGDQAADVKTLKDRTRALEDGATSSLQRLHDVETAESELNDRVGIVDESLAILEQAKEQSFSNLLSTDRAVAVQAKEINTVKEGLPKVWEEIRWHLSEMYGHYEDIERKIDRIDAGARASEADTQSEFEARALHETQPNLEAQPSLETQPNLESRWDNEIGSIVPGDYAGNFNNRDSWQPHLRSNPRFNGASAHDMRRLPDSPQQGFSYRRADIPNSLSCGYNQDHLRRQHGLSSGAGLQQEDIDGHSETRSHRLGQEHVQRQQGLRIEEPLRQSFDSRSHDSGPHSYLHTQDQQAQQSSNGGYGAVVPSKRRYNAIAQQETGAEDPSGSHHRFRLDSKKWEQVKSCGKVGETTASRTLYPPRQHSNAAMEIMWQRNKQRTVGIRHGETSLEQSLMDDRDSIRAVREEDIETQTPTASPPSRKRREGKERQTSTPSPPFVKRRGDMIRSVGKESQRLQEPSFQFHDRPNPLLSTPSRQTRSQAKVASQTTQSQSNTPSVQAKRPQPARGGRQAALPESKPQQIAKPSMGPPAKKRR